MLKAAIVALLSAASILTLPSAPVQNLKSSETKAVAGAVTTANGTAGQRHNTGLLTVKTTEEASKVEEATPGTEQEKPESQPEPQVIAEPLSDKELLMQEAGIPPEDWGATDYIVSRESSWNPTAVNPTSGATGLCQALPASKMASAGEDYMSNPVTQLRWCHDYAESRYSGWWSAFAFWKANRWW